MKVSIILKDVIKLSVNEAKLTGLCARNCANIQQVLTLKLAFGLKKFSGFSRNEPHYHVWTEYLESEKECGSLETGNR